MYTQEFYITEPVGNNAFSYEQRKNKQLYVPSLKRIESFDEVELLNPTRHLSPTLSCQERGQASEKVAFEDFDFDGKLQTCFGLKNLYKLEWKGKKIFLVDNHNHVHFFWYLARSQGIIADGAKIYHIDAHADMRDPGVYLSKSQSRDMHKVFDYTNFTLNVGNFIVPALREGLVSEVVQIRGEEDLKEYTHQYIPTIPHPNPLLGEEREQATEMHQKLQSFSPPKEKRFRYEGVMGKQSIILDLDLDFFAPEMGYIDFSLAKQVILDIASKADLITICTSPFFIKQERALRILREIFDK
ncbi:UPF0489 family protein [Candidatus Gracilibacteria bacterium]|nr:UPF0489 family protein [Candidatus Gracilibacteria bacterium]